MTAQARAQARARRTDQPLWWRLRDGSVHLEHKKADGSRWTARCGAQMAGRRVATDDASPRCRACLGTVPPDYAAMAESVLSELPTWSDDADVMLPAGALRLLIAGGSRLDA